MALFCEKEFCLTMDSKIGDIRKPAKKRARKQQQATKETKRYIPWVPGSDYVLLQKGLRIGISEDACESDFYIFRHVDADKMQRNPLLPVYEAVFYCDNGMYYRVQKAQLKMAYQKSGKTDKKRAFSVDAQTGLPYWVDRFAINKSNKRG